MTRTEPSDAPRVFISYAHEDDGGAHADQVRELYQLLRANHVDAQWDGVAAEQRQNWPKWMVKEAEQADFVLVIASPAYKLRAEGTEAPGVGRGVAWETGLLEEYVYRHHRTWHRRVLTVVLPGGSPDDLPAYLLTTAVPPFIIDHLTREGAEKLLRYLLEQPYEIEPELGARPVLPPRDTSAAGRQDGDPPELAELWHNSQAAAAEAEIVGVHPLGQDLLLSHGLYVQRTIEKDVIAALEGPGCTAVVGEAGYGKTSLVWSIHRRLAEQGRRPLFLRASSLLSGLYEAGQGDSAQRRGVLAPRVVLRAIQQAARREPSTVLLVDTVDLLMHSDDACALVVDVVRAADRLSLSTLLTCRPVEAQRLTTAVAGEGVDLRTRLLGSYDADEWPEAVRSYARGFYDGLDGAPPTAAVVDRVTNAASLGRALREVCANPFALRLLFELYAPDMPDEDVDTPHLYDRFWKRRVVSDQRAWRTSTTLPAADLSAHARAAARLILASSRLDARRAVLEGGIEAQLSRTRDLVVRDGPDVPAALEALRSRGVLSIREQTGYLWFFHQTFFEHAAARGVLACGSSAVDDLMDRVARDPGDLYFGEVAGEVLLMAGRLPEAGGETFSKDRADAALSGWLASDDPALLGMGLRVYAKFKEPGPLVRANAPGALRRADTPLIDRFLRLLPSVTHRDLSRPLDDLALLWAGERDRKRVRRGVIEALVRLATQDAVAVEAFTRAHGCFEWLRSLPANELHHNEKLAFRLLDAVVPANQERAVDLAAEFWRLAVGTGRLALLTDLLVRMARWTLPPRLVRTSVRTFMEELADVQPDKQDTVPFERAFGSFFLNSAPRAEEVLPELRRRLGLGQDRAAAGGQERRTSVLALRTTLRMHTAAVLGGLAVDPADYLDTVLSTREPARQLAVCYGVLTESLVGRAARFRRDPRTATDPADPAADDPDAGPETGNPLTVEARRRCARALRDLPCEENSPQGGKDERWLWRNALQEARLPAETLLTLLPEAQPGPFAPVRSPWLSNTGLSSFLISAATAGHAEARRALTALVGDQEVQDTLRGTRQGRAALENMVGRLQYAVPRHPELVGQLILYARTAAMPEVLHQTLGDMAKAVRSDAHDAQPVREWLPAPHRQALIEYRRRLVDDRRPDIRRHGFILWKVHLELGFDDYPTIDEIVGAWEAAAAQDLRNALLELATVTVPARMWDATAPTMLLRVLRPLLKAGRAARAEPPCRATEQVISHESKARMLLTQAHAHLGALHRADGIVAFALCLAERAGYDVRSNLGSGTVSEIFRSLGFLMERLVPEDPVEAARLTATIVEAMHRVQPENVKWKRDIARPWAVFLGDLCTRLTPVDQERWTRRMLCEPAFCTPVVSAAAQLKPKPAWLDALFREETTPASLRESMRGSNYLHARTEGNLGGWPELLERAPLY
ncbi:TIR domain-containing protein [Streptomyces sp. NPDC008222]|uniref:TIR domain-containing protein n=1 Tax=Streptomyces sp. NPDC008222 TaxID=3364820 RepID=UPI0036EF279B